MAALWTLPTVYPAPRAATRGGIQACFPVHRPLTLEIGCGKGESLVALAAAVAERNHVGIDLKSARLWSGARAAERQGLQNILFVMAEARQVPRICGPASVDEIWIPFPDPVARGSKAHKRLVSPEHLGIYGRVARPGARIHLKTDDAALFTYALSTIRKTNCLVHAIVPDVYASPPDGFPVYARSTYERRYAAAGRSIRYVCFELNSDVSSFATLSPTRGAREDRLRAAYAGHQPDLGGISTAD